MNKERIEIGIGIPILLLSMNAGVVSALTDSNLIAVEVGI